MGSGPAPGYGGVRTIGAVAALLLVGGSAASTVPEMMRTSTVQTEPLDASLTTLVLTAGVGKVDVREVSPGEQPSVSTELTYTTRRPQVELVEDPNAPGTVQAQVDCGPTPWFGCNVDWGVAVPAGTALEITTSLGEVEVNTTGDVVVRGATGDIDINGSPTSVDVGTSLGNVSLAVEAAPASVLVRTSVGDVNLRLPQETYTVRTSTQHGAENVTVSVAEDADHSVTVETTLGSIRITN